MPGDARSSGLGALLVVAAGALWGTVGVAGKFLFRFPISPLEAGLWRAWIPFVLLLAYALARDRTLLRVRLRDLPLFAAYGLTGVAIFAAAYYNAIRLTSVATAVMLLYTSPAWVAVLARALFGEPLTLFRVASVVLTFGGSALLVRAYDPAVLRLEAVGVASGLTAGLTYALYNIFGKAALRRYPPLSTVLFSLGFGTLFLLLFLRGRPAAAPAGALPILLYLALVPTMGAQLLFISGLRHIQAGRAAILTTVEPLVATLLAFIILGERFEPLQWLGALLVLAGVVLAQR